ncbi:hypothetical protein FB446DRAFT_698626 [Lentinula raphanica]|nr:hypothetical protein FB446DRAFT_698626 [Lentinula raphanica]
MNLSRLLFFVTLAVRVSCTSSNLRSSGDADPRSRNTPDFSSSSDTLRSSTPPVLGYHTTGHAKDNTNTNTDANVNASPNSVDVGMHVGGNLNSPSERTLVAFDHIDDPLPDSSRPHASSRTLTPSKSQTRDCIEFVKQNKALCAGLAFVGMCGIGFAVTLVVLQNRPHGSNDPTCPAPSGSHGGGCTNTTTMMKKRGVNSREGGEGGGEEEICRLEYNLGDECSCNAATEIIEANPNGEIQSIRRGPGREVKKLPNSVSHSRPPPTFKSFKLILSPSCSSIFKISIYSIRKIRNILDRSDSDSDTVGLSPRAQPESQINERFKTSQSSVKYPRPSQIAPNRGVRYPRDRTDLRVCDRSEGEGSLDSRARRRARGGFVDMILTKRGKGTPRGLRVIVRKGKEMVRRTRSMKKGAKEKETKRKSDGRESKQKLASVMIKTQLALEYRHSLDRDREEQEQERVSHWRYTRKTSLLVVGLNSQDHHNLLSQFVTYFSNSAYAVYT